MATSTLVPMVPLTLAAQQSVSGSVALGLITQFNAAAGVLSAVLPPIAQLRIGARLAVQKTDTSTNTVTITCSGSDVFADDGATTVVLRQAGEQREIQVINVGGVKRWKVLGSPTPLPSTVGAPVVALVDAATIAVDASKGSHFRVTLAGNRTLGAPSNARDGQQITVEFVQDATGSRTLGFAAVFGFGTDVASPTLSTGAGKRDYLTFIYNAAATRWHCLRVARGY